MSLKNTTDRTIARGSTSHIFGWRVIADQELRRVWMGWRAPVILIGFSMFLSVFTYLLATSEDLTRMGQTDMIGLLLQITVALGIILVILPSADSFSGERDRSTLEVLLLTPVPRGQIVFGKFMAAFSLWAAVVLVSIPYIAIPARGTGLFGHSVAMVAVMGSVLVVGFYFLGTIISALSRSNLVSFSLCFLVFFVLLAPMMLPGNVMDGSLGSILIHADPATAGMTYMIETMANDGNWAAEARLLLAPVIFLVITMVLCLFIIKRFLNLEGGRTA